MVYLIQQNAVEINEVALLHASSKSCTTTGGNISRPVIVSPGQARALRNIHAKNFDTVVTAKSGAQVGLENVSAVDVGDAGVRARDAEMTGHNVTLQGGDYGLDLLRSARGDLFKSTQTSGRRHKI